MRLKWNRKITILVLFMFVTITFASFNTNLFVDGKAYVRADESVRITNIELVENTNQAYETYEPEYTKNTITINTNLPKQNSTAQYRITIANNSDDDYDVQDIIEEKYSNNKISYNITGLTINDTILEAHTTSTFLLTLSNNTTITEEEDAVTETKTYTFDYTGDVQDFIVPFDGDYTLEVWGAQGGSYNETYYGGYGGYSKGTVHLTKNQIIYIYVGGKGIASTAKKVFMVPGGFNGGGNAASYTDKYVASGGGATHIATYKGVLSSLSSKQEKLLIVAGGGGGGAYQSDDRYGLGGAAGGFKGNVGYQYIQSGATVGKGGTQTAGGIGYDSDGSEFTGKFGAGPEPGRNATGGGGGYYGGGCGKWFAGGGGGSGYIGNELLTNKVMYCYNCEESNVTSTKTISTENHSATPTTNYAKEGNGYAKLTVTRTLDDAAEFNFDYTGDQQVFTAPYTGVYQLETWGAQGGDLQKFKAGYYGGYGGYSRGSINLTKNQTLYVVVGGAGKTNSAEELVVQGGYNGGGSTYGNFISDSGARYAGAGGGATHIATIGGVLSSLENDQDKVIMVSGGGAGSWYYASSFRTITPGSGGGYIGGEGTSYSNYNSSNTYHTSSGGTQTGPGEEGTKFGSFGSGTVFTTKTENGGSGGGWYGGNSAHYGAAGGSGYIGYAGLYDKVMYCFDCEESDEASTRTVTTKSHAKTPKKNNAKEGNGYARIKLVKRLKNSIELQLKFDIQKLTDYNITYDLDGGILEDPIESYTRNSDNFTLPTPTRTGYTFAGWTGGKNIFDYTKATQNSKVTNNNDGSFSIKTQGTGFTIGLLPNSSPSDVTTPNLVSGEEISVNLKMKSSEVTLLNSIYYCTSTTKDTYDICYRFNQNVPISSEYKTITGTFTLTRDVIYSGFAYYPNNGGNNTTNLDIKDIQLEKGNVTTSYEPYISTPSNNISITKGTRGNRTYTAVWTPKNYDITYDLDGGTLSNPVNTYNLNTETFTLPTPTKEGYEFLGWTGGKNLFDYQTAKKVKASGATMTKIDGGLRLSSTAASNCRYWYTRVGSLSDYGGKYYTYSLKMNASEDNTTRAILSKSNSDYSTRTTMSNDYIDSDGYRTILVHEPSGVYTEFILGFYANACSTTTATSYYVDYTNIQLEYGKEFTGYEDYIREPTTVSIQKGSMGYRFYKANWKDITAPTVSIKAETYLEGFAGWTHGNTHHVDNDILIADSQAVSYSPLYETNGAPWYATFDAWTDSTSPKYEDNNQGGFYVVSHYYDANGDAAVANNSYSSNGYSNRLKLNEWTNDIVYNYPNSYGNNIKYTKIGFTVEMTWSKPTTKFRNFKIHSSGIKNDFYDILITSSDNVGVTTTKYAAGSHDANYFKTNGTDVVDNKVRVTSNGTYTVYVADAEGNATVQEIEITNIVNAQ